MLDSISSLLSIMLDHLKLPQQKLNHIVIATRNILQAIV